MNLLVILDNIVDKIKKMHFILMTIEEWIELIIDAYNSGF